MNKLLMNKKVVNIINKHNNLSYDLHDNEMLVVNIYSDNQKNLNIDIKQSANSYFVLNMSCKINSECLINIDSKINGNNNRCVINVRALSQSGLGTFNVCSNANEGTFGNEIIEDLKGINEEGTITFIPILEINTNEIDAQHFASVGSFSQEELFYLQTKGISIKSAYELLKRSFIYSLFSDEFINLIKKGDEDDE